MGKNGDAMRVRKLYHSYGDTIAGFNFAHTPKSLRDLHGVNGEAYEIYVSLPYCRTDEGQILVNESLPDWQLLRDLLLALDRLPDSLLIDIYRMDSKRYKLEDLDNLANDTEDEMLRKTLFRLLPEVVWAHGFKKN